ncbi:MAG: hypothetical protein SFV81_16305 [Pirellulaceae bacterium]|nr:hypothetical protein [Pirellulaceae bacterium]
MLFWIGSAFIAAITSFLNSSLTRLWVELGGSINSGWLLVLGLLVSVGFAFLFMGINHAEATVAVNDRGLAVVPPTGIGVPLYAPWQDITKIEVVRVENRLVGKFWFRDAALSIDFDRISAEQFSAIVHRYPEMQEYLVKRRVVIELGNNADSKQT